MSKHLLSILLFLLFQGLTVAQIDRTRTWVFGESIGIHFSKSGSIDTLSGIYKPNYPQYEGTGVYNDSLGNPLYYVLNGKLIGNDNKPLNNDFAMGGGSSASQANIITSFNDSIFHIFGSSSGFDFNYSCFDKTSGKFKVLDKSLIYRASEAQALVNHENGRWKWVVCHSRLGDTLYSYLITENGLETCPVLSFAGPFYDDWYPGQGIIKFASNGKHLVLTTWSAEKVVLCSFNNQTGTIKELCSISGLVPYGAEFVDNKLFISSTRLGQIHEFDISNLQCDSIQKSKRLVYDTTDDVSIGQIQLAPNGNLYVAYYQSNYLGVISKINGVWTHEYTPSILGSKKSFAGFPNFNASYFYSPTLNFTYTNDCETNSFQFSATDTFEANTWKWQYSKGATNYSDSGKTSNFSFPDTGVWQVECIASNGSRKDTITKTIVILKPLKSGFLGEDILLPNRTSIGGTIKGPVGMHCVHWQRMGDTIELKVQNFTYSDTGYYICRSTNPVFCTYSDTIRVRVCDSFAQSATITRRNDSLFTNTFAAKYQWYRNDTALTGATAQKIKLLQNGLYKLRTWNHQGCDSFSASIQVKALAMNHLTNSEINVFPNPSNGVFEIELPSQKIQEVEIFSSDGRMVWSEKFKTKQNPQTIKFSAKPGIYFMRINETVWRKIEIVD
jgi:hypothetical protein